MKGYPAYRIEGLEFAGYISPHDVYVPVGHKETIVEAIEFHILEDYGLQLNKGDVVRYDNAVYVGIWDI